MAKAKGISRTAIVASLAEKPQTAKELAAAFGICVEGVRKHIDTLSLHAQVRAVGRRGAKEIVWGAAQTQLHRLPMFTEGPGDRRDDCQHYEDCLIRYDLAHPNSNAEAHCSPGCGFFEAIPREYRRAVAVAGRGVSASAYCIDRALEDRDDEENEADPGLSEDEEDEALAAIACGDSASAIARRLDVPIRLIRQLVANKTADRSRFEQA
jgi:hypothetical protein